MLLTRGIICVLRAVDPAWSVNLSVEESFLPFLDILPVRRRQLYFLIRSVLMMFFCTKLPFVSCTSNILIVKYLMCCGDENSHDGIMPVESVFIRFFFFFVIFQMIQRM